MWLIYSSQFNMTIVDCWNAKFWAESCSPMTGSVLTWSCVNNETLSSPAELFSALSYLHLKQCHRVIQHLNTNTHHLPALPRCSRRSLAGHSSIQTTSIHLRIVSGECPQRHLWLISVYQQQSRDYMSLCSFNISLLFDTAVPLQIFWNNIIWIVISDFIIIFFWNSRNVYVK